MKPTIELRRHPIAVSAALLASLLAAGCGQDEGAMTMQRPGMGPGYAQAPGSQARPPGLAPERNAALPQGSPGRLADVRGGDTLDALMAWERQDMGVRPTRELHSGAMHGPTPNQIPGGQVITTKGLLPLLQQGIPVHVFDVLGTAQTLPNAIPAARAAEPGSFDDETQQEFARMLQQVTRGNAAAPLVFYCQGPQCWMSYNAALRAIALGYRNVLWYRGGMEAWNQAGQPFAPAQRQG
ncbi:MAG: sulfurtransferase [Betaproteobacteria bacterium]|nr:sulfurtransferase [Betaproteobacteria bacterium]